MGMEGRLRQRVSDGRDNLCNETVFEATSNHIEYMFFLVSGIKHCNKKYVHVFTAGTFHIWTYTVRNSKYLGF
jgi:hypothetical protein